MDNPLKLLSNCSQIARNCLYFLQIVQCGKDTGAKALVEIQKDGFYVYTA